MSKLAYARVRVILAAVLAASVGCGGEADLDVEENELDIDGKDDSFYRPTDHGAIRFSDPQLSRITDSELFHLWRFTLSGRANVDLDTRIGTAFGPQLDTVMYLYKDGTSRYLFRNDNLSAAAKYSSLSKTLEAGSYRVVVKGKRKNARGPIALAAYCQGQGCYAADWLTALKEQIANRDELSLADVARAALPREVADDIKKLDDKWASPADGIATTWGRYARGGRRALVVELSMAELYLVYIYKEDGTIIASGGATESSNLDWATTPERPQ